VNISFSIYGIHFLASETELKAIASRYNNLRTDEKDQAYMYEELFYLPRSCLGNFIYLVL